MLKSKMTNSKKILIITPILIVLIVLAFAPQFLRPYHLSILRDVLMWMALAISWHFFSGLTKYVTLGSTAFVGTGIYFTAKYLQYSVGSKMYAVYPALPLPIIMLLAGLICFAVALVIGLATLRLKGIYFAILTFGVGMVLPGVFLWLELMITGKQATYIPSYNAPTQYYSILIVMIATLLLITFLRRTKFGLALKMIGENEEAAVHVGVNANLTKVLGFAVSAMCMGFAGGTFAIRQTYTNPAIAFNPNFSFMPAVMVMLGGGATVFGPIVGSVFLSLLNAYLSVTFTAYFQIILGAVLIVIVMFMPNGIMEIVQKLKARLMGRKKLAKAPKMPP